ncbi:hypothetical protein J3F83DRAFT_713273 [Trichoderma novae-zelandiae]
MVFSIRKLAAAALVAAAVSADSVSVDFEDFSISNTNGCGTATTGFSDNLHGITITDNNVDATILNNQKTASCNTARTPDVATALFNHTNPSPNNVLLVAVSLHAQVAQSGPVGVFYALNNDFSLDVTPVFTAAERNADNVAFAIVLHQDDFGPEIPEKAFRFTTADDGFGPFRVSASTNGQQYAFTDVVVSVEHGDPAKGQSRQTAFFVDNIQAEREVLVNA